MPNPWDTQFNDQPEQIAITETELVQLNNAAKSFVGLPESVSIGMAIQSRGGNTPVKRISTLHPDAHNQFPWEQGYLHTPALFSLANFIIDSRDPTAEDTYNSFMYGVCSSTLSTFEKAKNTNFQNTILITPFQIQREEKRTGLFSSQDDFFIEYPTTGRKLYVTNFAPKGAKALLAITFPVNKSNPDSTLESVVSYFNNLEAAYILDDTFRKAAKLGRFQGTKEYVVNAQTELLNSRGNASAGHRFVNALNK
jgi:hypothetical protein